MTSTRASSSSGENGIVMMSSTPCSKAASLVFRSPRRVSARTGVRVAPPSPARAICCNEPVAADVHVDDGQVGLPVSEHRRRLGDILRLARDVDPVVERELDHLDDQRLLDHDQDARRATQTPGLHSLTSVLGTGHVLSPGVRRLRGPGPARLVAARIVAGSVPGTCAASVSPGA